MNFNSNIELGISIPSPEGKKHVTVCLPDAGSWHEWRRKKKIQQKDLGRRSFQIEGAKPEQADVDLFRKIVVAVEGDTPADHIDAAEAAFVIGQISAAEVTERPEREGSAYAIRMKVLNRFTVTHTLRVPSMREMMDYERTRNSITFGQYGTQEIRINYRASGDLYDKLAVSVSGYEGEVPLPHKAEAVNVLLQEIRAEQEGTDEDLGE